LFDILVKDGFVIDGSGNPWFRADVGIEDGKIVKIGRIPASIGHEMKELMLHAISILILPERSILPRRTVIALGSY
jgi:dihydroorotase-like cyclic amidohydrolase